MRDTLVARPQNYPEALVSVYRPKTGDSYGLFFGVAWGDLIENSGRIQRPLLMASKGPKGLRMVSPGCCACAMRRACVSAVLIACPRDRGQMPRSSVALLVSRLV
jgi:hypothetical protein